MVLVVRIISNIIVYTRNVLTRKYVMAKLRRIEIHTFIVQQKISSKNVVYRMLTEQLLGKQIFFLDNFRPT